MCINKPLRPVLIREDSRGNTVKEKRIFGTMTQQLRELAQWLAEAKVSAVAMEATGVYSCVLERAGERGVAVGTNQSGALQSGSR